MDNLVFSDEDLKQMKDLGITAVQVASHIEIFKKADFFQKLNRPCTIGGGIIRIPESVIPEMVSEHQEAARKGRLLNFVPASGAASRMFNALTWFSNLPGRMNEVNIVKMAEKGDQETREFLSFVEGIRKFAFFEDLKQVMERDGLKVDELIEKGEFKKIVEYLLTDCGLNYVNLPKALLKFHYYPEGSRTALEEHLVEAYDYVQDGEGVCRVHFTVSPEHRERFINLLKEVKPLWEWRYQVRFQVDISLQKRATDTIAVDMNNQPFRENGGKLLFRPGGHGALIENLNEIQGDIIFIKNIDNVVPDRLKRDVILWKKILAGYLVKIQQKISQYLERMHRGEKNERFIKEVVGFAGDELYIIPPQEIESGSRGEKREFIFEKLNRPIRVCGIVKNEGEPGGGPFWVEGKDGSLTLQVVEKAQVDLQSEKQQEIWNKATHFNPVDIVCGVCDYQGNPFNLKRYVDQEAVFITLKKSKDDRDLKALELPGLWNGAMADWITIFIEVPIITFNPVKTIRDLLRKEHQP